MKSSHETRPSALNLERGGEEALVYSAVMLERLTAAARRSGEGKARAAVTVPLCPSSDRAGGIVGRAEGGESGLQDIAAWSEVIDERFAIGIVAGVAVLPGVDHRVIALFKIAGVESAVDTANYGALWNGLSFLWASSGGQGWTCHHTCCEQGDAEETS
jgi:hypothetical protein